MKNTKVINLQLWVWNRKYTAVQVRYTFYGVSQFYSECLHLISTINPPPPLSQYWWARGGKGLKANIQSWSEDSSKIETKLGHFRKVCGRRHFCKVHVIWHFWINHGLGHFFWGSAGSLILVSLHNHANLLPFRSQMTAMQWRWWCSQGSVWRSIRLADTL